MSDQAGSADSKLNVEKVLNDIFSTIPALIKSCNQLPKEGDDYEFYSSFDSFAKFSGDTKKNIMETMGALLKNQGLTEMFSATANGKQVETDELSDNLIACNDAILERVITNIDFLQSSYDKSRRSGGNDKQVMAMSSSQLPSNQLNLTAATPTKPATVASWNKLSDSQQKKSRQSRHAVRGATNKVQESFKYKPDNSFSPFIPKILSKPNALKPLPQSLVDINSKRDEKTSAAVSNLVSCARHQKQIDPLIYEHPYHYEIENFKPSAWQLQHHQPVMYKKLVSLSWSEVISTCESLNILVDELKTAKEIAIDLEAHNYRSYLGFTCLMQLSTRSKDYIVDTLALREDLHVLNEVFTDPNIVKVLHGSDQDVEWLQRDHGLYLVNMFDTGQGAKLLEMGRSLKNLLQVYCGLDVSKHHQMSDWRERPLTDDMLAYAQGDTHYLLYVYDRVRNDLVERGLIEQVWQASAQLCMKQYVKPCLNQDSHLVMLQKPRHNVVLRRGILNSSKQLEALRLLYEWRDKIARSEDESCGYVLPNHMLIQISHVLPRDPQGVIALCNPLPPLVVQHLPTIHQLIKQACHATAATSARNVSSAVKDDEKVKKVKAKADVTTNNTNKYDDVMKCPHDMTSCDVKSRRSHKLMLTSSREEFAVGDERCVYDDDDECVDLTKQLVGRWNPYAIFLPRAGDDDDTVVRCDDEVASPPTLKQMLSGALKWNIVRPNKKKAEEAVEVVEQGKVIEIGDEHRRTTQQQIERINNMGKEASSDVIPLPPPQQKQGGGKHGSKNRKRKSKEKLDFAPHKYNKSDFKRFGSR